MTADIPAAQFQPEFHSSPPEASLAPTPQWHLVTRVLFRFCFVYFSLYILISQVLTILLPIPNFEYSELDYSLLGREIVSFVERRVFHVYQPLVITGSGDKTYNWVAVFCLLMLSTVATFIWSVLDSRRQRYPVLLGWFHLVVRFAVGSTLFAYGFDKLIPLQMPYPYLTRLVEPFGNFSPMGVLWYSIGASPSYEVFTGFIEVLGGVLVMIPRTPTLGALICLADAVQIFMLNMTYDVPVKLFAFHLVLLSVLLLAPDFRRLGNMFFLDRSSGPSTQTPFFRTRRSSRIAAAAQLAFVLYLIGCNLYGARQEWFQDGPGAPKSALYGIWNVEQMSIDGQLRLPLLTDNTRWRRAIFQVPQGMNFERMDESFARFGTAIDASKNTITFSKFDDKEWKANFAFMRPSHDRLVLDGDMDGHNVHMELKLFDRKQFLLVNRGFHWVQESPLNR